MAINRVQAERQGAVAGADAFAPRYPRTEVFEDGGMAHDMDRLGT